jgi:hypothetical protein
VATHRIRFGTYGTNGFHLPFSDNSTAAALGTDTSSNGNTWTVNNISVTAGAGNDSLVDSPTNGSQVDTGVGGEVVGNYATLNPLALLVQPLLTAIFLFRQVAPLAIASQLFFLLMVSGTGKDQATVMSQPLLDVEGKVSPDQSLYQAQKPLDGIPLTELLTGMAAAPAVEQRIQTPM